MREVVVTGIGVILPNCDSREVLWEQLRTGSSQLELEHDEVFPDGVCAIGRVRDFDPAKYFEELPERFYRGYHRELQLYLAAFLRARDDARLDLGRLSPERIGIFDGSARTMFQFWYDRIRAEDPSDPDTRYSRRDLMTGLPGQAVGIAASLFKIMGPTYTFSGSCAAGAIALGHAYREIALGEIDVAFAGGHEASLVRPMFMMYSDANLLSLERTDAKRAVRPYAGYSTNAFGEGAVLMVLESAEHAAARGAPALARVLGYKSGNNGYHPTTVDVAGVRPTEIMKSLIGSAGLEPDAIDVVAGHGNAVQLSDVSEENYMRLVFGKRSSEVPLISTKPIYGHLLGASSALNAAAVALMVAHDCVIPTINFDVKKLKRAANHQPNTCEDRPVHHGVAMSYGMGGYNAALLIGKAA
ncbi:MAG: hypothetical protein HOW73_19445 [Polyangiaceae bacterium]|nr:hypothetical protein [Polyangiaceae bacterium]